MSFQTFWLSFFCETPNYIIPPQSGPILFGPQCSSQCHLLCSTEKKWSHRLGMTWGWLYTFYKRRLCWMSIHSQVHVPCRTTICHCIEVIPNPFLSILMEWMKVNRASNTSQWKCLAQTWNFTVSHLKFSDSDNIQKDAFKCWLHTPIRLGSFQPF